MSAPTFTPVRKVIAYYPQRVQVLLMAVMNFGFIVSAEAGYTASTIVIGATNSLVLALLVFFYGETRTYSKQFVADVGGVDG